MFAPHLLGTIINGLRPVSNTQRPMELEPGQVFRGVIVKAFPNQMVQVQLAGTTLYAQLNAPLEVGQQAWLQVLPKSNPITLQVIDSPRSYTGSKQASSDTEKTAMEGLLRGLGIKADRANIQNLQLLIQSGIPLKTEHLGLMLDLLRATSTPDRILQLLQLAHQRGLSITNEVIRSMEATLFGRALGDIMNQLSQQIRAIRQATPMMLQFNQVWQEARAALSDIIQPQTQSSVSNIGTSNSATSQQNMLPMTQQMTAISPASSQGISQNTQSTLSSQVGQSDRTLANSLAPLSQSENTGQALNSSPATIESSDQRISVSQEHGLTKFFRLLGIDYEQSLLSRNALPLDANSTMKSELLQQLKGILLELRGMDQQSSSIRETIEQGLRAITGQQLLMVNDGNTPWNSFIFQIPLPHMQKSEPSFIHIEGRRKGKEAIDHENCRLLFHLDLDALQQTMIDIQITNRIMSIQIYNNMLELKEWIDEYREEWMTAMQGHDYQLSSIKVQPLPQPDEQSSAIIPVQRSSYRGVDLRV